MVVLESSAESIAKSAAREMDSQHLDSNSSTESSNSVIGLGNFDEDTEDASETEAINQKTQIAEMKEQLFRDKVAGLQRQLQQLEKGTLPDYQKRLHKLEQQLKERHKSNELWQQVELETVEKEYVVEKKMAAKEFEERKIDLKESLLAELEDKKRAVEAERCALELTAESMEVKPMSTRKLRRRQAEQTARTEKRRKMLPSELNILLDDEAVAEDLKTLSRVSGKPLRPVSSAFLEGSDKSAKTEAKIVDGRLLYDKKWFHKGQAVMLQAKDGGRIPCTIYAIDSQGIHVRRMDHSRMKVWISQLHKGKFTIRKRTA